MVIQILAFSMLTLLGQPQLNPRIQAAASRPQNTVIQAIRAVKLHAPSKTSPTLGQHFAALEQSAQANNSPIVNAWKATPSGKAWIVTLVTSPGDISENTAQWKVTLRPLTVTPTDRVSKVYEAKVRAMRKSRR
jgi:hypothetical protein